MADPKQTNGEHDLAPRTSPPGVPDKAYALKSLEGEIIYIPCSNSAMRLLVTGKETENAFALVGTGGGQSAPIGFHLHREAHDVFLCLSGSVNVWANDKCRTMGPGDFASVPPRTVHQYQILGDHSEFIGLIVPGGWEDFFRFIGEPYQGAMWPLKDDRNPFEVLIPKLKLATEKFDMVPMPKYQGGQPEPFDGTENVLPGACEPYYLQNNKGPKYLVNGALLKPLATVKESKGRFSIASLEGSQYHENSSFSQSFKFDSHHAFHVVDGTVRIGIDGRQVDLTGGETVYVPKGRDFILGFASRYSKTYVFSSGEGLVEHLMGIGTSYEHTMIPDK